MTFPPVDDQMRVLMRGVDFGDDLTRQNMEKELRFAIREGGRTVGAGVIHEIV